MAFTLTRNILFPALALSLLTTSLRASSVPTSETYSHPLLNQIFEMHSLAESGNKDATRRLHHLSSLSPLALTSPASRPPPRLTFSTLFVPLSPIGRIGPIPRPPQYHILCINLKFLLSFPLPAL